MGNEQSGLRIKDVKRIWGVPDTIIESNEDIRQWVESPLVNAVQILLGKGIRTYWSTANKKHNFAAICIQPQYLSEVNLNFARDNLDYKGSVDENVLLQRPITPQTPVDEVDEYFVGLANQFVDQK